MTDKIRLLIVDDHPFFRRGVRVFLEGNLVVELLGEAENGAAALEFLEYNRIDVVLMDIQMPGMDGVETTRRIKRKWPETKILFLTSFSGGDNVYEALKAGSSGYITKDAKPEELIAAVQAVYAGGSYLGAFPAGQLLNRVTASSREDAVVTAGLLNLPETLTEREIEVLRLICRGMGNKEIAERLYVSEKTVKTHVTNIMQKLQVKSRTQAALLAVKEGLI